MLSAFTAQGTAHRPGQPGDTTVTSRTTHGARLLIACPDQPGIVAAVSQLLFDVGANIVHSDQHTTAPSGGTFYMRLAFELGHMDQRVPELTTRLEPLATRFAMDWSLTRIGRPKRVAIFVSREDHCLLELLWRQQSGDLDAGIAMVVSNHADLRGIVEPRGIPFHHTPMTADTKAEAEAQQLALMEGNVDLVVLARYMQILSADFIAAWPNRVINIHHGLLPAFVGASPYRQAHARGVKLIGATAHYVTPQLDAGPIIEQDTERVDHHHGVDELRRIGRYVERVVLARAVQWHVEDRVLVDGERTVVFPS